MKTWIRKLTHYRSALGVSGMTAFICAKLLRRRVKYKTRVPGIKTPVVVRLGTTDISVLKQVLIEKQYAFEIDPPNTIVDAGANIGLSAVYFANAFPEAKVIAIEPELENFLLLQENVAHYSNIIPLHAALWITEGTVNIADPGRGSHGYQVDYSMEEAQKNAVPASTVVSLMRDVGWSRIDLLKIDVEGAEKELFEHSQEWLPKVGAIMIELHDELRPGAAESFYRATKDFIASGRRGETALLLRQPTDKV